MTPEEIESRLTKIETTLDESKDAFAEANKVRDEVNKLRAAIIELAEAVKLIPGGFPMQMSGGKNGEGHKIIPAADAVIKKLKA